MVVNIQEALLSALLKLIRSMGQRRNMYSWIDLFSLLLLVIQVKSSTYYISPSSYYDDWCLDISTCFNLSEVTINVTDLNRTLILRPGNHSLVSNFTITDLEEFSLKSHSPVIINCGSSVIKTTV